MLNLKAAKELAARDLDSQGTGAKIAAAAPMSARGSRFAAGDRVEYLSETYQQWMPGTITRIREGGQTYDLDVKKGAHVSKLRPLMPGGSRGRSPAPLLSESHLVERGPGATSSLGAGSFAPPGSRPPSRPGSARGVGGVREPTPLASRTAGGAAASKESAAKGSSEVARKVSRPISGKEGVTTLQARQLHSEIAQVTQAIQGQAADWAEHSGEDMVSRAGAVTVRKMVETTKALLQGLEGALILRAGFIAGCFHMWRCETTLSRAGRLYQDEFERHHEEWTQHLEHTKASFEEQLSAQAEHEMTRKEIMKQHAALLIDKWAYGDKVALKRESLRAWGTYTAKERKLKGAASSIHIVMDQWADGKVKGLGRVALQSWHLEAVKERASLAKQTDEATLKRQHEEQLGAIQREADARMHAALEAIEQKRHDGSRSLDVVLAKWMKGAAQGLLMSCMTSWAQWARKQGEQDRRTEAVETQIKRFLEGNARGSKHECFLRWKAECQASLQARAQDEVSKEREQLNKMLFDQQRMLEAAEGEKISDQERRKREADNVVHMLLNKWEMGSNKGILKTSHQAWAKVASEAKKKGRSRQAVSDALLRSFEGDKKAAITISFRNWKALARSEKAERSAEEKVASQQKEFSKLMAQTQAEHDRERGALEDQAASLAARAHQACKSMLEQWFEGEKKGLLKTVFTSWQDLKVKAAKSEQRRNAVTVTIMRMLEGERRGTLSFVYTNWTKLVEAEREHEKHRSAQEAELDKLQSKLDKVLSHGESRMVKYASLMAGKTSGTLTAMVFSGWRTAAQGEVAEAESQREREVALEEMARQKQEVSDRRKATQAKVLASLGCRKEKMVLIEAWKAWHFEWLRAVDAQAHKLNHNKAMLEYSKFILAKKLKSDDKTLLAATFAEWHREGRVLFHQLNHESASQQLEEMREYAAGLERQTADMQDQLGLYDRQIDLITETLQKELQTKEELATELRNAHAQMRKYHTNFTPTTAATAGEGADSSRHGDWSRTSSEKTIDQIATPRQRTGKAPPALTVPALPGMPAMPQLPKGRGELLRLGGPASAGGDATPEVSPRRVDWTAAVSRMNEENGVARLRPGARLQRAAPKELDANHEGVVSRS